MNEDMILEIISYCSWKEIARFRLLNKECNKRSYEFEFLNRHLERTNSVFGYFIQYRQGHKNVSRFVCGVQERKAHDISLDFLPSRYAKIEACDTHHGMLLCVDEDRFRRGRRMPYYTVCKPATKQYQIIPNPKIRYFTIATGLMVIQSNPFRYKIVRVSETLPKDRRKSKQGFYNLNCEVFDSLSDSLKWKRMIDLELQRGEFFRKLDKPVSAYGFLHWLTTDNNVVRFCMRTETWSKFPVPSDLVGRELVSYEGKLGVIGSRSREGYDLLVLDKSCGMLVKGVENTRRLKDTYDELLWFPSNNVVSTAGSFRLGLYNLDNGNAQYIHKDIKPFSTYHGPARDYCFPFYSNYDQVGLRQNQFRRSNSKPKYWKQETGRESYLVTKCLMVTCFLFFFLFFISSILG